MNLLISATGTQGDVQPCVALARGLADAGHQVEVASAAAFQPLIEGAGLRFVPLWEPDPRKVMQDVQRGTIGHSARIRLFKHLFRRRPPPAAALQRQVEICRGRDVILSPISNYLHISEALGIPFCFLAPYPTLPTRQFPHHLSRLEHSVGGWGNGLTHLFFRQLFWIPDRHWVNGWRREMRLAPLGWSGPHPHACRRRVLYLYGYSPAVLPRPNDWPETVQVTGFWFLDTARSFTPSPELERFLESGPPPVVMGFGSLVDPAPADLRRCLLEALAATGQRGLLLAGWGSGEGELPATVHRVDWVPLPWLLPRVRAILHHGGAGTSAEALRAGVASVTIPYSGEQRFWAGRLCQLGVGSRPIPRKQLQATRLTEAIRAVLEDSELPKRLTERSRQIRNEDGVDAAVRAFESWIARKPKPPSRTQ